MRELKVKKVNLVKYIRENINEYANVSSDEYFEFNPDWGFSLNFFFQDTLKDVEITNPYDQIQDVRFVKGYGSPDVEIYYYETEEDEDYDDHNNPYGDWENTDSVIEELVNRIKKLEKEVQIMKQPRERIGW